MKPNTPILLILLFLYSSCSPKTDEALLDKERKLSNRSSINRDIEKLDKSLSDARDDYERAVICSDIASLHDQKGNIMSAMNYAQKAVRYQPALFMPHYLLGKAYLDAGRYDEAEGELVISRKLKDDHAPSHFEMGNLYYKKYNYPAAISEYQATIKLDPGHYQAYNNLASLLSQNRRFAEAKAALESAIRIKPDFAVGYKNLGIIYELHLKNYPLAIQNYRKYLELRPDSTDRNMVRSWIIALGGSI